MPMLLFIVVIGAAAGFLATRLMRVEADDVPTTIAIGVVGSVLGWLALRMLLAVTGFVALFVGSVLGAMALIWLWQTYISR